METRISGVKAGAGFDSQAGPREHNEDFAGAVFGWELPQPRGDIVAAIADGIGGAKGGRVAAETAVRGFLDGFCDLPETMEVRRASVWWCMSVTPAPIGCAATVSPALPATMCGKTAAVATSSTARLV